jgi:site-specific recombinase XerD
MKRISTFNDLLNQYILEKPLSDATIVTYKSVVSRFSADTGIEYLHKVRYKRLLDWRLTVTLRSSDITWNNYLRHMRALWKFAIKKKFVPKIDHFKELNWGKYNSSKTKTITSHQLKKIICFLSNPQCSMEPCWFWKTVVLFMYLTGVRRLQLVTIRWKDINFTDRTIYLSIHGEKTDISRTIPMGNNLEKELTNYRNRLIKEHPISFTPESQLFNITALNSRYAGKEMNATQLSGFFKRLGKNIDFPISSHRLRHTMATEIAKTGQIKPLQQILGHTDIGTTMNFYVHPDMDQLRSVINSLNDI